MTDIAHNIRLSVNLNKVALLRNARHTNVPNVLDFADLALEAGAHGITLHPRSDERHVRARDVTEIARRMKPLRPQKELNIEGTPDERFVKIVSAVHPEQCTLVPDAVNAFTSDKGWELNSKEMALLHAILPKLRKTKTRIILFVDPGFSEFKKARELGAEGIEIYTGRYAELFKTNAHAAELKKIVGTAKRAHELGLHVHIGHDLNLKNLPPLLEVVRPYVSEASIGHELTADALQYGFQETVRRYAATLTGKQKIEGRAFGKNPFLQFKKWYAETNVETQPNAMVLATAPRSAHPSARIVFLRKSDAKGFTFFTNYKSRKGAELAENPNAALLFHWNNAGRQVRITGSVGKVSRKESEEYFSTRPRESQLSAWASEQSSALKDTDELEKAMRTLRKKYDGKKIPLPPHWGGFRLTPRECEFWEQGDAGRLHTRLAYIKKGGRWEQKFLAP
ncbi:pyridoxine 5'-phosphate synthase [Patescibacteria group bacterium]|nr:pyridoxine 5'-phosphate synthase [Patescibacteria group bacterium]